MVIFKPGPARDGAPSGPICTAMSKPRTPITKIAARTHASPYHPTFNRTIKNDASEPLPMAFMILHLFTFITIR